MIFLHLVSHTAGITGTCHHAWLIDWSGILLIFCWGWPWTAILPISTFWIVEIKGVNNCAQLQFFSFKNMTRSLQKICLIVQKFFPASILLKYSTVFLFHLLSFFAPWFLIAFFNDLYHYWISHLYHDLFS
jgi:hypothetical protein